MSDRLEEFYELVALLLEHMRWSTDAYVRAAQEPKNDVLYARAHDLGENLETVKRHVADALIDLNLPMNDRIRAVCPFSATVVTQGSIRARKP